MHALLVHRILLNHATVVKWRFVSFNHTGLKEKDGVTENDSIVQKSFHSRLDWSQLNLGVLSMRAQTNL